MFRSRKQSSNSLDEKALARKLQERQANIEAAGRSSAVEEYREREAARRDLSAMIPRLLQRLDELDAPGASIIMGRAAFRLYDYKSSFYDSEITIRVYLLSTGQLYQEGPRTSGFVSINSLGLETVFRHVDRMMAQYGVR